MEERKLTPEDATWIMDKVAERVCPRIRGEFLVRQVEGAEGNIVHHIRIAAPVTIAVREVTRNSEDLLRKRVKEGLCSLKYYVERELAALENSTDGPK